MDASPAEGPDPFSRVLPLPFRLELEIVLGFWLWALNLHGFYLLNIDIFTLIRYPTRPAEDEPPLHVSTYRLAGLLTGLWMGAMVLFWHFTGGQADLVIAYDWIPNLLFLAFLAIFLVPRFGFAKAIFGSTNASGVTRLFHGLRRVALGGIAGPRPEKFGDVLLADALTSYAKPISEVFVAFCMFFKGVHTTDRPDRLCGHELIVPLALAWPFVIRLRQCLKEGQWANAAKYATAFPVLALSSLARTNEGLQFFWRLAAITNSLYSFWWDVSMDWDLTLLSKQRHMQPFGLRQQRVFRLPMVYYLVVAFDIVLRFAWSFKLSLHLVYLDGIEGGIFLLEIMELLRRWVWVYFRVETEWVRSTPAASVPL
ncbi:related to ERD1, required for retention of luminal ER s [Lecanosticta acicola]|uniref:Related to ERD1, required for retention of luminal ER s n=1 Tax=Lecanosticta acicola TaxID=111012 RepID=A0AAI9E7W9_9PEZI|nr:related to ERD1, required for retention of luminal ER s [Lecanosticta acicola]